MKTLIRTYRPEGGHWVGDGFPVRTLFNYGPGADKVSPFLLFDHAGPTEFEPADKPRGVGSHPHRGFETVTIVYDGEVSHRDSGGNGGTIGPGDVQWMTAASGVVHEEFHSEAYTKTGGPFHMVQLWVNLPAKDKMTTPRYQSILKTATPTIDLNSMGATARIIAGEFNGVSGPADAFTPVDLWDVRLPKGADVSLPMKDGHTSMLAVLKGAIKVAGQPVGPSEIASLSRENAGVHVTADDDSVVLVLGGEPIPEPVFGHGPFVMNNRQEIIQAFQDFEAGRFGGIA